MAIISDVKLQNFMPRNILESDDDLDTSWSSGGSSQCSDSGSYVSPTDLKNPNDYCVYEDYFGLNNLVHNIKISEDNPLLCSTQKKLEFSQDGQSISWGNDGGNSTDFLSAIMDNPSRSFDKKNEESNINSNVDSSLKQLPPPSMRLSKSMRDHIISGAYQQEINNRSLNSDKVLPQQPSRSAVALTPSLPSQENIPPQLARPQTGLHVCVFCRNNGESESVYTSHVLKDSDGRTSCPILRAYTCPICKSNGDSSHTIKYCPMNQNGRFPSSIGGLMGHPSQGMGQRNYQAQLHGGF